MGPKGMVLVPDVPKSAPEGLTSSAAGGGQGSAVPTKPVELPAIAREVYDVSGAGDTVVAIMTLGLAARAPMVDSMHIANTAAALVVEKWGTQPIELAELQEALQARPEAALVRPAFSTQTKSSSRELVRQTIKEPKSRHKKVVFTNGCFDLLHAGHVSYLEQARSLGDVLVVGVNSDDSVRKLKGPTRPYVTANNRMRLLAALSCVDFVIPFNEETPLDLITYLSPDVLVKGSDYDKDAPAGSVKALVGADFVREQGGSVETIALVAGLSTTALVDQIKRD
jgi:D-beta-D-heptose 7-phosphate kinase/D-beta-D-heptose 1-phosphate adenosyltransferase